jgi:hypothetical protein
MIKCDFKLFVLLPQMQLRIHNKKADEKIIFQKLIDKSCMNEIGTLQKYFPAAFISWIYLSGNPVTGWIVSFN